jgi:hypothetical protein
VYVVDDDLLMSSYIHQGTLNVAFSKSVYEVCSCMEMYQHLNLMLWSSDCADAAVAVLKNVNARNVSPQFRLRNGACWM